MHERKCVMCQLIAIYCCFIQQLNFYIWLEIDSHVAMRICSPGSQECEEKRFMVNTSM